MTRLIAIFFSILCATTLVQAQNDSFKPIEVWPDSDGEHLNAHGAGILYHKGRYYMVGEHKITGTSSAHVGIRMYSSKDLYNWRNEGVVMSVDPAGSGSLIEKGCVIERPKLVYNKKTKKFVIWFHLELKGQGYSAAMYGVAQSDNITGPYKFLYADRSCQGVWPMNMSEEEQLEALKCTDLKRHTPKGEADLLKGGLVARDLDKGQMSRDMTIFVDDDGTAYHIFASEENATLHIAELTDDYLYHTGRWVRAMPGRNNEAPSIFKKDGIYWMVTSGCTGWAPNKARLATAKSIWGPWTELPNPCRGEDANITFGGQSTHIFKVEGKKDRWIFMADVWRPKDQLDSRYIWLPITFDADGTPLIEWQSEWKLY